MNENNAIEIKNVSKTFQIESNSRNSIKNYFVNPFRKNEKKSFNALDNVSIEINKGDFIGIIGRNGSGKSTLLKVIAGIYIPDQGTVQIDGKLVPFLELGVGFNPELSGRENVFLNGTILGMTRKYLDEKFDEIVDFAEVRQFIDVPLKNYSSGMMVRLAFAIAIHVEADIFLLDEVLAVGDISFQKKCFDVIRGLLDQKKTIIYVSHDMGSMADFANKVLYMKNGKNIFFGDVNEGIRLYKRDLLSALPEDVYQQSEVCNITNVRFIDADGNESKEFKYKQKMGIELTLDIKDLDNDYFIGLAIKDKDTGAIITATNSLSEGEAYNWRLGENKVVLWYSNNLLNVGKFFIDSNLIQGKVEDNTIVDAYSGAEFNHFFTVKSDGITNGLAHLDCTWEYID